MKTFFNFLLVVFMATPFLAKSQDMMSSIPWECMYYPNSDICAMPMAPKSEDVMFNITLDETLGDSPRVLETTVQGTLGETVQTDTIFVSGNYRFRIDLSPIFLYGDFYYFSHNLKRDGVVVSEESGCTVTITEEVPYGEELTVDSVTDFLGGNTIHMSSTTRVYPIYVVCPSYQVYVMYDMLDAETGVTLARDSSLQADNPWFVSNNASLTYSGPEVGICLYMWLRVRGENDTISDIVLENAEICGLKVGDLSTSVKPETSQTNFLATEEGFSFTANRSGTLTVIDTQGRLLSQKQFTIGSTTVSLSRASATYVVRLTFDDGTTETKRLCLID